MRPNTATQTLLAHCRVISAMVGIEERRNGRLVTRCGLSRPSQNSTVGVYNKNMTQSPAKKESPSELSASQDPPDLPGRGDSSAPACSQEYCTELAQTGASHHRSLAADPRPRVRIVALPSGASSARSEAARAGEMYCVECRVPVRPAGDMADYPPSTTTSATFER